MRINQNIAALQTATSMLKTDRAVMSAMNRLSTGVKINSAKDDAAGLAIATKLKFQITGLERASKNTMDGVSLIQSTEGALTEVHAMLQRMRELAVNGANATNGDDDRQKIQDEINQLMEEITSTANKTEFNRIKVLEGEVESVDINGNKKPGGHGLLVQTGPNYNMNIEVSIPKITAETLFDAMIVPPTTNSPVSGKLDYSSEETCTQCINYIEAAIEKISSVRSTLGAYQNRFEQAVRNIDSNAMNMQEARSRIMDTNMAEEMTVYSQKNVLAQAGVSILAQANQRPQQILSLLQ